MAFFRIKKIKNIEYAYLIKNKWTKKGARQKMSKYMGKLIRIPKKELDFLEYKDIDSLNLENYIKDNSSEKIIDDLIELELISHGFFKENNKIFLSKEKKIYYDIVKRKLSSNIVLYFNEGYFCNYSVKNLLKFDYLGEAQEVATELAKTLVNTGLSMPQEVFIYFFKKIYTEGKPTKLKTV